MAVNSDTTNKLYDVNDTSVKFFSSLTRRLAKGLDSFVYNGETKTISDYPGAICYVSDSDGNSIFLNKLLFGDGTKAGSGSSGGITEVNLDDIAVVTLNGEVLKTLADYFNADGDVISDSFKIMSTSTDAEGTETSVTVVEINSGGITISGSSVLTEADVDLIKNAILSDANTTATTLANTAESNAKSYADSLLTSVYKIKGSVNSYSDLVNIRNPEAGDVYNVINEYGVLGTNNFIPAGTNYVYVVTSTSSYWDSLGGTINLSAYKTAANTTIEINEAKLAATDYTDTKISEVNTSISEINESLVTITNIITNLGNSISQNSASIATNTENIEQNTTNITNISTQLTWQ